MTSYKPAPDHIVSSEADLRSLFPPTHDLAIKKVQNYIDKHARAFIERSPFICIGTQGIEGRADVSPRGDPAGFVKIIDDNTLAIPDRPGNNRLDSLSNIVANPNVGLLFVIPGFDDTMRVNGKATLVTDPDLLKSLSVDGRVPRLAILVEVGTVFIHCAKAFRRSHLWNSDYHQDRSELPSLMKIALDATDSAPSDQGEMDRLNEELENDYQKTLY